MGRGGCHVHATALLSAVGVTMAVAGPKVGRQAALEGSWPAASASHEQQQQQLLLLNLLPR